ncbi:hypothetical protein BJV82DRAFT_664371 [Fennellomyces sp. T-0311]|nr:hypothetical protein BJV82DRAFT_664371 [Fennellomyces sp. T-0311]
MDQSNQVQAKNAVVQFFSRPAPEDSSEPTKENDGSLETEPSSVINDQQSATSPQVSIDDDYFTLKDLIDEQEEDQNHDIGVEVNDGPIPDEAQILKDDDQAYKEKNYGALAKYFLDIQDRIKDKDNGYPREYAAGNFWVEPKASHFALQDQDILNPEPLYYPRVFLWFPHLLVDQLKLDDKGFYKDPHARRVVDLQRCFYIMSRRYKCKACGTSLGAHDEKVLAQLPDRLAAEFPAILTYRCGISKDLIDVLRPCVQHGMGFANFQDMLNELHSKRHIRLDVIYTLYQQNPTLEEIRNRVESYAEFSAFKDPDGYAGYIPSVPFFRLVYNAILDETVLELGKFTRRRGYIDHGGAPLSVIAEAVLGGKIKKDDKNADWELQTLSQTQLDYAALDAWVSLAIYTKLAPFRTLGNTVQSPPPPGAYVAVFSCFQWSRPIAYGEILPSEEQQDTIDNSVAYVSINHVLVPAAILDAGTQKTLSDFGTAPFIAKIPVSMLRFEKKSLCEQQEQRHEQHSHQYRDTEEARQQEMPIGINDLMDTILDKNEGGRESSSSLISSSSSSETRECINNQGAAMVTDLESSNCTFTVNHAQDDQKSLHPRVLKDIYHFMALIKVPKRHALAKEFSQQLRNALFVPDPEDKRKVEEYLAEKNLTWAYIQSHPKSDGQIFEHRD